MVFNEFTYGNMVTESTQAQSRLFLQYLGPRNDFDVIVIGSGVGGGILADDLADRLGESKRILCLEAGSFVYPTHVYNFGRFDNTRVSQHFACDTFWQAGNSGSQLFIGSKPQLNLGGRSIFWSGLIPSVQGWELRFFPDAVRADLESGLLSAAGAIMNESRSMGSTAQAIVSMLRQSPLAQEFSIQETPRALHQPYLTPEGVPTGQFFTEPTGVFNTAELLINQLGLTPGVSHGDGPGLQLLLNHYVEDVQRNGPNYVVVTRNVRTGDLRPFSAATVVLAGGSIESPKLLRRSSSLFASLPEPVRSLVGRGLTDHPTSSEVTTHVTNIGNVQIPKSSHAKIIFYSRGRPDPNNPQQTRYPFNVEMNVNHEYWHLRENDPNDPDRANPTAFSLRDVNGPSRIDIKFSFGNCLDDGNEIKAAPAFGYVPEIQFHNQNWMDRLRDSRFPALAGWHKSYEAIFAVLDEVTYQIFRQFQNNGVEARPLNESWYANAGAFGTGTVHHAAGSLRMPYRPAHDQPFSARSVVDENLQVIGAPNLYVCDMSVMPFSSAANPVRTLAALALRLSKRLG